MMLSIQDSSGSYSFTVFETKQEIYDIKIGDLVKIKQESSLNHNQWLAIGNFDSRIYKVRGKIRQIESIQEKNGIKIFITKRENKGELNKFAGSSLELISSRDIMMDIEDSL